MHDVLQNVMRVALVALQGLCKPDEVAVMIQAMDLNRLRSQMLALGLCEHGTSDVQVAKLYFSKRCSAVSPNAFFDEAWYVSTYNDVEVAVNQSGQVSGFVHFIQRGLSEGRWPNSVLAAEAERCTNPEARLSTIDPQVYLRINPGAAAFIAAFPSLTPLAHYNAYGRLLGYKADRRQSEDRPDDGLRVVTSCFDAAFYQAEYLDGIECDDPLTHYLNTGARAGHSPNAWFDERWYCAFYPEVQAACEAGWLPSGFFHYLHSGWREGRQPRFDLTLALEARMPGVTAPALLGKAAELGKRLHPTHGMPQFDASSVAERAIWIMFPTLNPDIMFGGYRALLWLVVALVRAGFSVKAVCLQEEPNMRYFLLREGSPAVRNAFSRLHVLNVADFAAASYSPNDLFMAYTIWDLPLCARLAAVTHQRVPFLLAQEFEPIFYDNGSHRALCEAIYRTPHFAIFNSDMLRDYFLSRGLGVFSDPSEAKSLAKHTVFQHRIMQLPRQTAAAMAGRQTRLLVLYARPEAHAARNVFEIAILALQRLCETGFFGPEWRFEGIGALSKLAAMTLGNGHEMILREKRSEAEYERMCSLMDVGVSLMYAPHPSVIPFEFATTGAMVVTNTYENRSAARLEAICRNIVPCDLSIEGVAAGIRAAVERLADVNGRAKRALVPATSTWDEVFSHEFLRSTFGAVSDDLQASSAVVTMVPRSRRARTKMVETSHQVVNA